MTRLGKVTFYSHTDVEHIKAVNHQALCVLDIETGEITLDILMKAFAFENVRMQTHFNESYVESDLYPKATFKGKVVDFDKTQNNTQIRMINGLFTLKNITTPLVFKVTIDRTHDSYVISGTTTIFIDHYNINIPRLFASNISKEIKISFHFDFHKSKQ